MQGITNRRDALRTLGVGLAAGALAVAPARAADTEASLIPKGATTLADLSQRLAKAPRRRSFKTVPMILTDPDQWDHEALTEVLTYAGKPKQTWDNTDLPSPWLNLMRNSMNAQIWSFKHPDFLCVSATHGSAHLALYDDAAWQKYGLAKLTSGKFQSNTLAIEPAGGNPSDFESPSGLFSPKGDSIAVLQRRGAVFLACHNAIWELSAHLAATNANPDHVEVDALAADLTNHLIPGIVLTPGAVGTLVELQDAGFTYAK